MIPGVLRVYWIWDENQEILSDGPFVSEHKAREVLNERWDKDQCDIICTALMVT